MSNVCCSAYFDLQVVAHKLNQTCRASFKLAEIGSFIYNNTKIVSTDIVLLFQDFQTKTKHQMYSTLTD